MNEPFETYPVIELEDGSWAVYYATPNCLRGVISEHETKAEAQAAAKRYALADGRRSYDALSR